MGELWKKLNYKGQSPVLVIDAPDSFSAELASLPPGTAVRREPETGSLYGFVIAFAPSLERLGAIAPRALAAAADGCVLWFAFPKQASKKYSSDLNRDIVWKALEPLGLQPNRNVAIDDDWSALRFKRA